MKFYRWIWRKENKAKLNLYNAMKLSQKRQVRIAYFERKKFGSGNYFEIRQSKTTKGRWMSVDKIFVEEGGHARKRPIKSAMISHAGALAVAEASRTHCKQCRSQTSTKKYRRGPRKGEIMWLKGLCNKCFQGAEKEREVSPSLWTW